LKNFHLAEILLAFSSAYLRRCCRTLRARQQSPRITIRWVLGAPRLTTSGCSRLRVQTSKLAHVLAADPRRFGYKKQLMLQTDGQPFKILERQSEPHTEGFSTPGAIHPVEDT
jgi:hypothetical protein